MHKLIIINQRKLTPISFSFFLTYFALPIFHLFSQLNWNFWNTNSNLAWIILKSNHLSYQNLVLNSFLSSGTYLMSHQTHRRIPQDSSKLMMWGFWKIPRMKIWQCPHFCIPFCITWDSEVWVWYRRTFNLRMNESNLKLLF